MDFRNLFVDIDGTVLDVEELYYDILGEATQDIIGLPKRKIVEFSHKHINNLRGRKGIQKIKYIVENSEDIKITDLEARQIVKRYYELKEIQINHKTVDRLIFEGVEDFVKKTQFRLFLVTSSDRRLAQIVSERLSEWYNEKIGFVCSDDVEKPKPAPDLYLQALKRTKWGASGVGVLEDSFAGKQSAMAANIPEENIINMNSGLWEPSYTWKQLSSILD